MVGWLLVNRVYRHLAHMRQAEETALPELPVHHRRVQRLALNRERARFVYHQLYEQNARTTGSRSSRADTYHLSAVN